MALVSVRRGQGSCKRGTPWSDQQPRHSPRLDFTRGCWRLTPIPFTVAVQAACAPCPQSTAGACVPVVQLGGRLLAALCDFHLHHRGRRTRRHGAYEGAKAATGGGRGRTVVPDGGGAADNKPASASQAPCETCLSSHGSLVAARALPVAADAVRCWQAGSYGWGHGDAGKGCSPRPGQTRDGGADSARVQGARCKCRQGPVHQGYQHVRGTGTCAQLHLAPLGPDALLP